MRKFLFSQKFRFDLGQSFLGFMNFTLLLIAASDKLKIYLGIERTWVLVLVAVVGGYICVWLFGFFLDTVVKYQQHYSNTSVLRNPHALENYERLKRIEKMLGGFRCEK